MRLDLKLSKIVKFRSQARNLRMDASETNSISLTNELFIIRDWLE